MLICESPTFEGDHQLFSSGVITQCEAIVLFLMLALPGKVEVKFTEFFVEYINSLALTFTNLLVRFIGSTGHVCMELQAV